MNSRYIQIIRGVMILFNAAVLAAGIWFAASGDDYSASQKENSRLIGASYMTMNNEFYKILSEEIAARVEAEGDRMVIRDPALNSDRQIEQINEMLDMGIDVLVLAPVDWKGLNSILQKAKSQGVMIVVVDTNVEDEELVDCTITSDNYHAGVIVGEYFLKQHKKARLIVMSHETARSGQDRVQGFLDTVRICDGIEIVKTIECEGQLEIAMLRLQEAIDEGISFDSVFCLNDLAAVGVVAALDENHLLDEVDVYGVDASPDSKAMIHEGMMQASAAQFPSKIGKCAASAIYRLVDGKYLEKVISVPVELVTQENVTQFGIDRWQ